MLSPAIHNRIYAWGLPLLLFLMPFNNIGCNILILLLSANWLLEPDFKSKLHRLVRSPYILLCLALFALTCIELCFTHNAKAGRFAIEKKLSLLCFPLVIGTSAFFQNNGDIKKRCYEFFFAGTLLASVVLLGIAGYRYMLVHDAGCFFYHALVKPFGQHAVYFSVYIYISLVFMYQHSEGKPRGWLLAGMLLLAGMIILLSSKLIICLFLLHILSVFFKRLFQHRTKAYTYLALLAIVAASAIIFLTKNPVRTRFSDLTHFNAALLKQEQFAPADYFNAWQLRCLLWKFSLETLGEQQRWLAGVSPGDAQDDLNAKVRQYNMYVGEKSRGDYGYLHHNCHNQYVQSLLETGVLGLGLLLGILAVSFAEAKRRGDLAAFFVVFIFSYFFLTESALERMIGIVPFMIFLSLLHTNKQTAS